MWKEDIDSRRQRAAYVIRPIAPYFCRRTGRILSKNLPHLYIRKALGDNSLPECIYRYDDKATKTAARLFLKNTAPAGLEGLRSAIARWLPGAPVKTIVNKKASSRMIVSRQVFQDYSNLLGIVGRLEFLERLRALVENGAQILDESDRCQIVRCIAILQDAHQLKLLCMEDSGLYSNAEIARDDSPMCKHYDIFKEGLHAVMHEGELPDLASVQCHLPFWDRSSESSSRASNPFDNDLFVRTILRIFTKAIFQPSKVRQIQKSFYKELDWPSGGDWGKGQKTEQRRLVLFFSRLILCSLLGMYSHTAVIPKYGQRQELYRWLSYDVPTVHDMQNWFLEHKLLMTFTLRENHVFTVEAVPGLARVFRELYEYSTLHTQTLHSMDEARVRIGNSIDSVRKTLEDFYSLQRKEGIAAEEVNAWRRYVNRRQFTIRCALLMNSGEMILNFVRKFGGLGQTAQEDPRMLKVLRHVFWKFVRVGSFCDVERHFRNGAQAEPDFRTILIYWLLLRDCCHKSSQIQTSREYEKCYKNCLPWQIVAPLPSKYAKNSLHHSYRVLALESEARLVENFICAYQHPREQCTCLRRIMDSLVEGFDVLRLLEPQKALRESDPPSSAYYGLEKYLNNVYTTCLNYCYRPRLTSFAEEVVSSCTSVLNLFGNLAILARSLYPDYNSLSKNLKCTAHEAAAYARNIAQKYVTALQSARTEYKQKKADVVAIMRNVIYQFPPEKEVGIAWLIGQFKIKVDTVLEMDEAYSAMWTETNHRSPYNAVLGIAKDRPHDFWIIRAFFKLRHARESIRLYPTTINIARQQLRALHETHNVVPVGQPLPKQVTRYYFCPYHKRLLAPRVGTECGYRGYVTTRAVGPEFVSVDPLTDEKFCTVQTGRNGGRRCIVRSIIPGGEDARYKSIPREFLRCIRDPVADVVSDDDPSSSENEASDRSEKEDDQCGDVRQKAGRKRKKPLATGLRKARRKTGNMQKPTSPVIAPLPAKPAAPVAKSKKKRYSKCATEPLNHVDMLGTIFMLYKNLFILCPYCARPMRLTREKHCEIGMWCGCCVQGRRRLAAKLGISWDHVNDAAIFCGLPDSVGGIPVRSKTARCAYCGTAQTANRTFVYCLLYEDLEPAKGCQFAYIPFCRYHAKNYIGCSADSLRLSNVILCQKLITESANTREAGRYNPRYVRAAGGSAHSTILMPTIMFGTDTDTAAPIVASTVACKTLKRKSSLKKAFKSSQNK